LELRVLFGTELGSWASGLAWALTYVAHAVVWAAVVALLASSKALSSATRHACWKAALFGPLLSALLAASASYACAHRSLDGSSFGALPTASLGPSVERGAASVRAPRSAVGVSATYLPTGRTLALLALLGISGGGLRFAVSAYLVQRRLRGRAPVTERRILERFARLRARMKLGPVLLTESRTLQSPLVIGVREVCVPRELFSELSRAEMDAVLAHELAHVERKDGLWFPLVAAVQSALWLQPLNHLVSSYIRRSAELACDDRAVELTGSPLGLARALVHVAERASDARQPALVPTMVRRPNALLPRVRRLTNGLAPLDPRARAHDYWTASLKLLALGAALAALNVRVAGARTQLPDSGERGSGGPGTAPTASPPDVADQSARMAELATREQALIAELSAVDVRARAGVASTPDHVRALELNQELRHVRATQLWLEERFAAEWAAFEARSITLR
jgi:beta-lactamase regulating signal transducer with metallopeptidase domain